MRTKSYRMKRTIKIFLLACVVFICLQLYYAYTITQNDAGDAVDTIGNFYGKFTSSVSRWNESEINPPSLLYKDWNISTACMLESAAQHALNRAVTPYCKNGIVNVFCTHQNGQLYPLQLPRHCPLTVNSSERYLGCFRGDTKSNIFNGFVTDMSETNTPSVCINHCLRIGFNVAALQNGYECWCGKGFTDSSLQVSDHQCNISCPRHEAQSVCGGYSAMSVYLTGLVAVARNEALYVPPRPQDFLPYTGVRIIFVLTVNGRALRQVTRLLRVLYRPYHYYYIHVDTRREYLYRELSKLIGHFSNIRMDATRHSTIWGGASLLTMLLDAMHELLEMGDWQWDYFLNLSESDYPIKSVEELEAFLTSYKGKNFVKSHGKDTIKFIRKQGLNMLFYECEHRMWRLGPRQLQEGIRIDGGSDWICLSHEFIQYVVGNDTLLSGLKSFWKYALLPAESFFHTVLQNSLYCDTVVNNNLHFTNWRRKQGCKCQYKHIVDWCGCSPNDILPQDFHRLLALQRRPVYFARKFEPSVSLTSLNLVDELVYGINLPADLPSLTSFWLNEYHHEDVVPDVSSMWISIYLSFVRMSLHQIKVHTLCHFFMTTLLESTLFIQNDKFVGIVVTYEARTSDNASRVLFESLLKPSLHYKPSDVRHDVSERLVNIEVGTNFDAKEALFRNYAGLIASDSEIAVQLLWRHGRPVSSVALSLITPEGLAADVTGINVTTESATNSFYHPQLSRPLLPGVWIARATVVSNGRETVIGETPFLVIPNVIGEGDSVRLLLDKAWTIAGNCASSDFSKLWNTCQPRLAACSSTSWSTRYPDPKSWIDERAMWSWIDRT